MMKCKICHSEDVSEDDPICDSCKTILYGVNTNQNGYKI